MNNKSIIKAVVGKAVESCGVSSNAKLAKEVLKITPPSLSGAIARGGLPDSYYLAIEKKCGLSKGELFEAVKKEKPYLFDGVVSTTTTTYHQEGAGNAQCGSNVINGQLPNVIGNFSGTVGMSEDLQKLTLLIQELRSPIQIRQMLKEFEQEKEEFNG